MSMAVLLLVATILCLAEAQETYAFSKWDLIYIFYWFCFCLSYVIEKWRILYDLGKLIADSAIF